MNTDFFITSKCESLIQFGAKKLIAYVTAYEQVVKECEQLGGIEVLKFFTGGVFRIMLKPVHPKTNFK